MHIHPYAVSYLYFDKTANKVLDVECVTLDTNFQNLSKESFNTIFSSNNDSLNIDFSKVRIGFSTDKFMLLPENVDEARDLFQYSGIAISNDDIVVSNKVSNQQYVYFVIPNDIYSFFENKFNRITWYFGDLPMLKYDNSKLDFKNHFKIFIAGNDLSISLVQDKQVAYFNKFFIQDKQDLLYYLKLAYNQFNLDTNQFATYIYGFIEERSPLYSYSYNYIRNFEIDRILIHDLGYLFTNEDIPMHYYINLLGIGKNEN